MALIRFNHIGIKAVAACVPKTIKYNRDLSDLMSDEEISKVIDNIGIKERRYADADICSSDLCLRAAELLLQDNEIMPDDIDMLIFLSQTSDYHQPSTAPIIQHRLGLNKKCACFDVNLACSGYVYGLSIAYSFINAGLKNVLLLVGETMSKTVSQYDKVSTPLFGDAGTASLISRGEYPPSVFSLNTDGGGSNVIKMQYGGYRNPSCLEGLEQKTDVDGNIRSGENFFMDGMEVFNFGIKEEPKDIRNLLKECDLTIEDVDLLIYHQANKFMTDFFSKKLKISKEKTPYSLEKFGNTSSASIPLTIVTELINNYPKRKNTIISGFGAGLSWGSALIDLTNSRISPLIEY